MLFRVIDLGFYDGFRCSVSMEIDTFVGEGNPAGTGGGVENWSTVVDVGLCECARGHSWVQLESRDSRSCSLFLC
ncbi:hypothetical protein ACSBR1_016098 [Camellia fascicularis]